jgi:hypothetical protein
MALVRRNNKSSNQVATRPFNPNQLMYDMGLGAAEGVGRLALNAVRGIVSAFQARGASKKEITQVVAPLARSLAYTSRPPRYMRAEGGLMIEHIESIQVVDGKNAIPINTQTFTWLRPIAENFEEYQIKLDFAWNPVCPATTTGQVRLAFDYDPADGLTGYNDAADYFNTADHCISAVWAPAAISPRKSGWLKTGLGGSDVRLISPGTLFAYIPETDHGFVTVRYQVHLRKPQPASTGVAMFNGSMNVAQQSAPFTLRGDLRGEGRLIKSITPTAFTVAAQPGYRIVTYFGDNAGTVASLGVSDGVRMGTRSDTAMAFTVLVLPNAECTITPTFTVPGLTAYKVTVSTIFEDPRYL